MVSVRYLTGWGLATAIIEAVPVVPGNFLSLPTK